jgi:post-segregation antitoxin (ccd killing protein)
MSRRTKFAGERWRNGNADSSAAGNSRVDV